MAPGRNPGFFMMVIGREANSLCECPASHEFVYYQAVENKALSSAVYKKEVVTEPLSVLAGQGYFQHGSSE